MGAVVIVSVFAFLLGAPAQASALAAALGLAPAVSTILLAPRWGENWAASIAIDSWSIAAAAAVSLTGGAASPVSSLFLIAPALALRLFGPARARESVCLSVLAFAAAAFAARAVPATDVVVTPGAFTVLSLAFAGWLIVRPPPRAPAPMSVTVQKAPPAPDAGIRRFAEAAHELRTPLNHIVGFAEIMQREMFGPLPPKYAEYVDLILASGKRMSALATDWLDMGRLDAGRYEVRRERMDLAVVAREAVQAAKIAANEKDQTVILMGADFPAAFEADPRALRQIFDNLLTNAVKFAPHGGRITVRLIAGSHAAVIDVEDNGSGVSAEDKARLGEAFERGAGAEGIEGAGLGLMLVKALAGAHGGRLDVLDAEGGGALMRVILPAAPTA